MGACVALSSGQSTYHRVEASGSEAVEFTGTHPAWGEVVFGLVGLGVRGVEAGRPTRCTYVAVSSGQSTYKGKGQDACSNWADSGHKLARLFRVQGYLAHEKRPSPHYRALGMGLL